jgi:hypothetical protein
MPSRGPEVARTTAAFLEDPSAAEYFWARTARSGRVSDGTAWGLADRPVPCADDFESTRLGSLWEL